MLNFVSFSDVLHSCAHLSKHLLVHCEGEIQDICDVVIFHPLQALMELFIQVL